MKFLNFPSSILKCTSLQRNFSDDVSYNLYCDSNASVAGNFSHAFCINLYCDSNAYLVCIARASKSRCATIKSHASVQLFKKLRTV